MIKYELINLIVPILCDFLFSGIIILFVSKKLEQRFTRGKIEEHYAVVVMQELKKQIEMLKMHMIKMQTGVIEISDEAFRQFFYISGDLQIYIEDYEDYIRSYENKYPNFFLLSELKSILAKVISLGMYFRKVETSHDDDNFFGESFSSIIEACTKVIRTYNSTLAGRK